MEQCIQPVGWHAAADHCYLIHLIGKWKSHKKGLSPLGQKWPGASTECEDNRRVRSETHMLAKILLSVWLCLKAEWLCFFFETTCFHTITIASHPPTHVWREKCLLKVFHEKVSDESEKQMVQCVEISTKVTFFTSRCYSLLNLHLITVNDRQPVFPLVLRDFTFLTDTFE